MSRNYRDRNSTTSNYSKGGEKFSAVSSRKYPSDAIEAIPLEVVVQNNFDRAFRTFRSLVQKERILSLFKEKQSFEKRSDKKRRKRNESRRKLFEMEVRRTKILSGEFEKEKLKRDASKEKRRAESAETSESEDSSSF